MKHPILKGSGYKPFFLSWVAIAAVNVFVLRFYFELAWMPSVVDSFLHHVVFMGLSVGLWYVVTFAALNKDELSVVTTHTVAAAFLVGAWVYSAWIPLQWLFLQDDSYRKFLDAAFWGRVVIGLLYYSIVTLIFYLIEYYRRSESQLSKQLKLEALLKDTELMALKTQINPHFIFNSLNSISALTIAAPAKAQQMVIKLSDFLRHSLGKEHGEMNQLGEELDNVMVYLEIEKVRFGDRLQMSIDVPDQFKKMQVPNLILQPLIENAVKYGVYDNLEDVKITISCKQEHDSLLVTMRNTYDPDGVSTKGEGIGLNNVRKRMSLTYAREDLLEISSDDHVFSVVLKLPIQQVSEGS